MGRVNKIGDDFMDVYRLRDDISRMIFHRATAQTRLNIYLDLDILQAVIFFDRWEIPEDRKQWFGTPRSLQEPLVY